MRNDEIKSLIFFYTNTKIHWNLSGQIKHCAQWYICIYDDNTICKTRVCRVFFLQVFTFLGKVRLTVYWLLNFIQFLSVLLCLGDWKDVQFCPVSFQYSFLYFFSFSIWSGSEKISCYNNDCFNVSIAEQRMVERLNGMSMYQRNLTIALFRKEIRLLEALEQSNPSR